MTNSVRPIQKYFIILKKLFKIGKVLLSDGLSSSGVTPKRTSVRDKCAEGQQRGPLRQAGFPGLLQLLLNHIQERVRVMLQECVGLALLKADRPEGRGVGGGLILALSGRQLALHPAEGARKSVLDVGELLLGPTSARKHLKYWNGFWHGQLPIPGTNKDFLASLPVASLKKGKP